MAERMASFSHDERIAIAPLEDTVVIRLETTTSLEKENNKHHATTPFPHLLHQLVHDYGVLRILVQTGSFSTSTCNLLQPLQDEWSTGPSGVSILLELEDDGKFLDLLEALVGYRLILAPLNAIHHKRLHRHVYKTRLENGYTQFQVNLPMEGSAVASEGLRAFLSAASPCANQGILSSQNAKSFSHVLLGDSNDIAVSHRQRRSMWMDVKSNCTLATDTACFISIRRGMQYGVWLPALTASLSKLVPLSSFQACAVADTSQLSILASGESRTHDLIDDWNTGTILNLSTKQQPTAAESTSLLSADRTLHRPSGVANSGRLVTQIASRGIECPVQVRVVEVLPPYIVPRWDTWTLQTTPRLSIQADGTIVAEWNATLAPSSRLEMRMDYEPVLLPFQRFPADPNRGIELPPTIFHVDTQCAPSPFQLYSSPVLLMPPVPDMSMPFNVISLTCTLYAFIIGSLANLLTRKSSEKIKHKLKPPTEKSKLQKLKEWLRNKFTVLRKGNGKTAEVEKDRNNEASPSSSDDMVDEDDTEGAAKEPKIDTDDAS